MSSSSSALRFPNAAIMTTYLSKHPLLDTDYFKEKGITEAVAKLAADRFGDSEKAPLGIEMGVQLIAYDLQQGEDGFTGAKIKKIDGMAPMFWTQFTRSLNKALTDCAHGKAYYS